VATPLFTIKQKTPKSIEDRHDAALRREGATIPTMTHLKALKRILRYIKGTIDFGLFYGYSSSFDLVGNSWQDQKIDVFS